MASRHRSPKTRAASSSIKYKWIPLVEVNNEQKTSKEGILRRENDVSNGQNLLSTAELTSAMGALWRVVGHPSAACRSRDVSVRQGENGLWDVGTGGERSVSVVKDYLPTTAKSNYERLKAIKKMLLFGSWDGLDFTNPLVSGNVTPAEYGRRNCVRTAGDYGSLVDMFGSLNERYFIRLRDMVNVTRSEDKKKTGSYRTESRTCPTDLFTSEGGRSDINSAEHGGSSGKPNLDLVGNTELPPASVCSAYSVASATNMTAPVTITRSPGLYEDCHIELLPSTDCTFVGCQQPLEAHIETLGEQSISKDGMHVNGKASTVDPALENEFFSNQSLSMQDKLSIAVAKKKHALAGALAGAFVSICLHPVDTVKTVIQARGMNQMTNFQTFQSIISERGLVGLYRGIASNIASSAPTSAVYTFTYETVKAAMLPILPKEYHSLAHCTAGGCASIATSFIFTPSERIKQQMQVRSYYQNCWSALIGVLEKGGLPSLYAGWGAVLCRNIPHSVIKFYTYESLKKLLLPSSQPNACLNTLQTLFCGGLAGSTAALFTTPFDVVKTRLQTQVPGSLAQYDGVFHALQQIAKHEGLRGLYRGLTPRLAMYVSQGAIFFASYEFFKTIFSLDMPNSDARVMDNECNEDDCTLRKLHKLHSDPEKKFTYSK